MLGMLRRIVDTEGYDTRFVDRHTVGIDVWKKRLAEVDIGRMAEITTVPAQTIVRLADEFAAADGAFATTRVGVQTEHNTTLRHRARRMANVRVVAPLVGSRMRPWPHHPASTAPAPCPRNSLTTDTDAE